MIFAITYVFLSIITAGAIIYYEIREKGFLTVEDIFVSLIGGAFWWISILCVVSVWIGENLNSRTVIYRRKK